MLQCLVTAKCDSVNSSADVVFSPLTKQQVEFFLGDILVSLTLLKDFILQQRTGWGQHL